MKQRSPNFFTRHSDMRLFGERARESLSTESVEVCAGLSGRPRVEALVACGAHQIHTQGTCTREVGGRESGRGRERERACVPVPLSSGEREEGAHAHFSSQKAALNQNK
jgi:hypothetical protein